MLQVFGLLEAKTAGKPIPGDVAYDDKGNATTDPAEALKGAIRVFDRCVPRPSCIALLSFSPANAWLVPGLIVVGSMIDPD